MTADDKKNDVTAEPAKEEIAEEQKKINRLRTLVDLTLSVIIQSNMPITEAQQLVEALKRQALVLFPGKEDTFELIYRPRFNRIIREKYLLH
jgi:hypothetical protein